MAILHPIIEAAGREQKHPSWAVMSKARRDHSIRVGRLLWKWSAVLELKKRKRIRWRAAGILHDCLKGETPSVLRREVEGAESWPDPLLHGPACAERLRGLGVSDEKLLLAIAHHTTGHAGLGRLGQALYMADYLDPGRYGKVRKRADWRRRMPLEWQDVLEEVAAVKIKSLIDRRVAVPTTTVNFWNGLV